MGRFHLSWDSGKTPLGTLTSTDLLLNSLLVECIVLATISHSGLEGIPLHNVYAEDHGAEILELKWSNPFDVIAMIKSVTQVPLDWVLNRTIYYQHEVTRRNLENQKLHQEVVETKINNINRLIDLRAKALASGIESDSAAKVIAEVSADMRIELRPAHDNNRTFTA